MRFSHLSLNFHRVCPRGLAWVVAVCAFAAGNVLGDPIEIVPTQGSTISTNINQREPAAKKDFGAMVPAVKNPFQPEEPWQGITPDMMPPAVTRTLSPREKQLLERRRNWVFMTPEEMMSGDSAEEMLGRKRYDKDGNEKESMTAMERYYESLVKSSRNMATNQFDKDSDSWGTATNTIAGPEQNDDNARSFDSPFNSSPARGVFRPMRPNSFSDIFGTRPDTTTLDPETIRAEKEQKVHMESFKQLWDIDQPSTPAETSISGSRSSSSRSSSSFPSMQPVLGTVSSSVAGSSAQAQRTSTQPAPTPVHAPPPRPNFTMPQRQF